MSLAPSSPADPSMMDLFLDSTLGISPSTFNDFTNPQATSTGIVSSLQNAIAQTSNEAATLSSWGKDQIDSGVQAAESFFTGFSSSDISNLGAPLTSAATGVASGIAGIGTIVLVGGIILAMILFKNRKTIVRAGGNAVKSGAKVAPLAAA